MNKPWFKPKKYGYGFRPITWQGWLLTLLLLAVIFLSAHRNNVYSPEIKTRNGLGFLLDVFIITGLFTALFKDRVKGGYKMEMGREKT